MSPSTSGARSHNRIAAVLVLCAAGMASAVAAGAPPVVFASLSLVLTLAALAVALRGQSRAR